MKQSVKRILIAGGAGFIGSNFVRYLYRTYPLYQLYNVDSLTYAGNVDNLLDLVTLEKNIQHKRYHFLKGDICDIAYISRILKKVRPDVVINFAAESHVDRSIVDGRYFFRTNLIGVHNLVDQIIMHKIPKFIQISTDEVYGEVLKGESDESSAFRPSNPYSASKAAADLLVQAYIRTHKIPAIILRGSNTYGPHQYPEKLLPLCVTNLLEGKKVPIHGKGLQKRRWLHVDDFSTAVDLAMHKAKDFSIYNISGNELSNLEIVTAICKVLHIGHKKNTSFIKDRPGGDRRYAPDDSKIRKELGWKPKFTAPEAIAEVVKWYLENKKWWKKIKNKSEFKLRYTKQYRSQY